MRKMQAATADFGHGKGPQANVQQPLEVGKGKNIDSPLEHPERNAALLSPWF